MLAANERGDMAFAWEEYLGSRRGYHASVMVGHAGGKLGRPLALGRVGGSTPSVAVGPSGDVLVAWRGFGSHAVLMRYRPPGARHFGSLHGFRVAAFYQRIATLVAPDGSAYVAAVGADGPSEGGSPALYELHAVAKPPNRSRFRTMQTLEDVAPGVLPILPDTWAEPRLAITAGHVALAWTGWDGAHLVVKESAFDRGHFAAPATFSLPDTNVLLGGLALAPDGGALVTWGATGDGAMGAALRGQGAAFGTPEVLLAPGPGALYWPPAVAASPSAPSALAVWLDRSLEPQKANLMIAARTLDGAAPADAQPQPRQP